MAIQEHVLVELATVEVNDDYRVQLTQLKLVLDYSPEQAAQLGQELIDAATSAESMMERDRVARVARMTSGQPRGVDGEILL
jgi:hypothetical protein